MVKVPVPLNRQEIARVFPHAQMRDRILAPASPAPLEAHGRPSMGFHGNPRHPQIHAARAHAEQEMETKRTLSNQDWLSIA